MDINISEMFLLIADMMLLNLKCPSYLWGLFNLTSESFLPNPVVLNNFLDFCYDKSFFLGLSYASCSDLESPISTRKQLLLGTTGKPFIGTLSKSFTLSVLYLPLKTKIFICNSKY